MVDHRAIARSPGRAGVLLVVVGGLVAHQFEGVAPFDQRDPLGDEVFQFDRLDLGAVADRVLMMENSIYSVISPEGCASIMWRDSSKKELAAQAM